MGALVAEELGNQNYARVQYNNMIADSPFATLAGQELLRLALAGNDQDDIKHYNHFKNSLYSYDRNLKPTQLDSKTDFDKLGSVVFIHESGLAPHKVPKGKIKNDQTFQDFFRVALSVAIASKGNSGIDESILLYFVGEANNPIAQYVPRTEKNLITKPTLTLGSNSPLSFTLPILDDFEQTAFRNFNDEYPNYVRRNVGNIAGRVLLVYLSSKAVEIYTQPSQKQNSTTKNNNAGFWSLLSV